MKRHLMRRLKPEEHCSAVSFLLGHFGSAEHLQLAVSWGSSPSRIHFHRESSLVSCALHFAIASLLIASELAAEILPSQELESQHPHYREDDPPWVHLPLSHVSFSTTHYNISLVLFTSFSKRSFSVFRSNFARIFSASLEDAPPSSIFSPLRRLDDCCVPAVE